MTTKEKQKLAKKQLKDVERFYEEKEYIGERRQIEIFLSELKQGIVGVESEYFCDGELKEEYKRAYIDIKTIDYFFDFIAMNRYVLEFNYFYGLNFIVKKGGIRFIIDSNEDLDKLKKAYWMEVQRLGYYSKSVTEATEELEREVKKQAKKYGKYIKSHLSKLKKVYQNVDETLPPLVLYSAMKALEKENYCEDAPGIQDFSNICTLYDEFGNAPQTISRVMGYREEDVVKVLSRVKKIDSTSKK